MYRNSDRSSLVGNRTGDRLTDPPGCIGRKLKAFGVVKFFNSFDQTHVAFLNQIQKQHAAADIFFGNRNDQTQIGRNQNAFSLFITGLNPPGNFRLIFRIQQRYPSDFLQIHLDWVIDPYIRRTAVSFAEVDWNFNVFNFRIEILAGIFR